jgi:hypothetical protein
MLIEEITKQTLRAAKFWELNNLRFRFIQVYDRHIQKGAAGTICGMEAEEFLNRYVQLRLEMAKRRIPVNAEADIDKRVGDRIWKRGIWTVDVPGLADIVVAQDFVAFTGDFVKDPKGAGEVTMIAKTQAGALPDGVEARILKAVASEIGREGTIQYQPEGTAAAIIPIYDLVLKAKPQTKKTTGTATLEDLEKAVQGMEPTTSAEFHRVPVQASDGKGKIRYFWISEEKGIKCLEDMNRKKVLAFLFTVDKWTMAEATAWVDRYKKEKMGKSSGEVASYSSAKVEAMNAEQRAGYDAENKKIDLNRQTLEAKGSHKFTPAKYPQWGNEGGERCLICGAGRPLNGEACPGSEAPYEVWADFYKPKPAPFLADIGKAEDETPGPAARMVTWDKGSTAAFFKDEAGAIKFLEANPEAGGGPRPIDVTGSIPLLEGETEIEKIETTATFHRIPVLPPGPDAKLRTIAVSEKEGISALYDVTGKRIVTYLFDRKKWKLEDAKTWVDDHKPEKRAASVLRKGLNFRIMKIEAKKQMVGGIIYEPNEVDTQDDYTDANEITAARDGFMEKYAKDPKRIKVMHKGKAFYFPIIECFQPDQDTKKGNGIIKAGAWWLMVKVTDPEIWASVEKGDLQGFSMGGRARAGK